MMTDTFVTAVVAAAVDCWLTRGDDRRGDGFHGGLAFSVMASMARHCPNQGTEVHAHRLQCTIGWPGYNKDDRNKDTKG